MKRRVFLRDILKGGAGILIGGTVANEIIEAANPEPKYPFVAAGTIDFSEHLISDTDAEFRIIIDDDTQTISFENPPENGISMNSLYKMLREEWENHPEIIDYSADNFPYVTEGRYYFEKGNYTI